MFIAIFPNRVLAIINVERLLFIMEHLCFTIFYYYNIKRKKKSETEIIFTSTAINNNVPYDGNLLSMAQKACNISSDNVRKPMHRKGDDDILIIIAVVVVVESLLAHTHAHMGLCAPMPLFVLPINTNQAYII